MGLQLQSTQLPYNRPIAVLHFSLETASSLNMAEPPLTKADGRPEGANYLCVVNTQQPLVLQGSYLSSTT